MIWIHRREPSGPGNGAIPSFILDDGLSPRTGHLGLRSVPTMESDYVHPWSSFSEYSIPEGVPPQITSGSGVIEPPLSENADDAKDTTGPTFGTSAGNGGKRWRPLRALYARLGLRGWLRHNTQLESESDHDSQAVNTANSNQPRPLSRNSHLAGSSIPEQTRHDEPLNSSSSTPHSLQAEDLNPGPFPFIRGDSGSASSAIAEPMPATDPLIAFNERMQKFYGSVGWVYSAPEFSKNDVGEPLFVWSVEVLVDGEILGRGTGNSKKAGRRAAAQQALALMDSQNTNLFGETPPSLSEVESSVVRVRE